MRIVARYLTGGPISARATAFRPVGGAPVIIAGSDALYAWQADDGRMQPGFPVYGQNFFASQPLVIGAEQAGVTTGDSMPFIFAGNDDDRLYGFDWQGKTLPGFPLATGGDVYSSPVAADVDGDGMLELFVGSDDGYVYAWKLAAGRGIEAQALTGWPQGTGGFVSATPVLADVDGDGLLEVIAGSWDGHLYAWRADGSMLPGWPLTTGQSIWSAALVADVDGDGRQEIFVASDRVYGWRYDGSTLAGWPQETTSYTVGTPLAADLTGDGQLEIITAADRVYAWRQDGRSLPGFPLDMGTFFWAAPALGGAESAKETLIILAGWDGLLYSLSGNGLVDTIRLSAVPLFASPMLADLDGDGLEEIVVGSWDGYLYMVKDDRQHEQVARKQLDGQLTVPAVYTAGSFSSVREASAPFIAFPGPTSTRATMYYKAGLKGDDRPANPPGPGKKSVIHPVPLVVHRGQLTGLVQPFPAGMKVNYWLEGEDERQMAMNTYHFNVVRDWPGRLRRRLRRRRVTQ